ncbi:unnamed protein product, partial [Mesorhabditis belari]|uniref:Uncharacterized protein n=1 Tax=Mesorhabditis belari TaxID=2138241 RepID=A0AAF3EJS8_9BILA
MFSFTKSPFWQRYQDIIIIFVISNVLIVSFMLLVYFFFEQLRIHENDPDTNDELLNQSWLIINRMSTVVLLLSLLTTPFAIYFPAVNDRLSLAIRLLAVAENINKFVYAFIALFWYFCESRIDLFRCSDGFNATVFAVNDFVNVYDLTDVAQYCQFLISLSRFLVVSFNGLYFRYTSRWPLAQLIFPYILRVSMQLAIFQFITNAYLYAKLRHFIPAIPYFFTCGLDYATNRNMKLLKKNGRNTSRAENLLMIQMMANSMLIWFNYILAYIVGIMLALYFGLNALFVFDAIVDFNQFLFFHLIASIISALFLRKSKERPQTAVKRLSNTAITIRKPHADSARIGSATAANRTLTYEGK